MESQLKKILQRKSCFFDRYMYKIQYIKSKDDIREDLYLTPVITLSKKKVLFITKEIAGNWFDSIKDIEDILYFLDKQYGYSSKDHSFIFHIFIESIKFEQFYTVDLSSEKKLFKIAEGKLEKVLE